MTKWKEILSWRNFYLFTQFLIKRFFILCNHLIFKSSNIHTCFVQIHTPTQISLKSIVNWCSTIEEAFNQVLMFHKGVVWIVKRASVNGVSFFHKNTPKKRIRFFTMMPILLVYIKFIVKPLFLFRIRIELKFINTKQI